jgi:hypothetical protein
MTLNDFFFGSYGWSEEHAPLLFLAALLFPVAGALAARVGKGGKTDADGKFIASAVVGLAMIWLFIEVTAIAIGVGVLDKSVLEANILLLAAPIVCAFGSVMAMRLVVPLNQIGSVRTIYDLLVFAAGCALVIGVCSKFRGWGIVFFGSFTQLILIGALALFLLYRLGKRAFGLSPRARVD